MKKKRVMKEFDNGGGDMRVMIKVSKRVSRWCERFETRVNRVMCQMEIKLMVVVVVVVMGKLMLMRVGVVVEVFVVDSVGRIRV